MKVLIVGGGGREHALAWKCAQSPRVRQVFVAPGNAGTALEPKVSNVDIAADDIDGLLDIRRARGHRTHHRRTRGAAGRRHRRSLRRGGARLLRALARGRAPGRIEGVHQGFPQAPRHTHGELCHLHRGQFRSGLHPRATAAAGREGGRTRRRQGRGHLRDARIGHRGGHRHARRQLRRRRPHHRDRGIPARRGSELHRDGAAASRCVPLATSQDHKRRDDGDQGPNTGGMGAYSPAPIVDAGAARAHHARGDRTDAARTCASTAIPTRVSCTPV